MWPVPQKSTLYKNNVAYEFACALENCIFNTNNQQTALFLHWPQTHHTITYVDLSLVEISAICTHIDKYVINIENTINIRQILIGNTKILYKIDCKERLKSLKGIIINTKETTNIN